MFRSDNCGGGRGGGGTGSSAGCGAGCGVGSGDGIDIAGIAIGNKEELVDGKDTDEEKPFLIFSSTSVSFSAPSDRLRFLLHTTQSLSEGLLLSKLRWHSLHCMPQLRRNKTRFSRNIKNIKCNIER
jgi:hypothetical protein